MTLKEKLVKLLNVKTVIAVILTGIFGYMAVIEQITPEVFMPIFTMVIAFYFGEESGNNKNNNGQG